MIEDTDDLYDESEWDDDERDDYLGREGCVFPGQCLMPGMHYESECHTIEMLDTMDVEEESQFLTSAANLKVCAELFIKQFFGPRCDSVEPNCSCCQRWKALDELLTNPFEDY